MEIMNRLKITSLCVHNKANKKNYRNTSYSQSIKCGHSLVMGKKTLIQISLLIFLILLSYLVVNKYFFKTNSTQQITKKI